MKPIKFVSSGSYPATIEIEKYGGKYQFSVTDDNEYIYFGLDKEDLKRLINILSEVVKK